MLRLPPHVARHVPGLDALEERPAHAAYVREVLRSNAQITSARFNFRNSGLMSRAKLGGCSCSFTLVARSSGSIEYTIEVREPHGEREVLLSDGSRDQLRGMAWIYGDSGAQKDRKHPYQSADGCVDQRFRWWGLDSRRERSGEAQVGPSAKGKSVMANAFGDGPERVEPSGRRPKRLRIAIRTPDVDEDLLPWLDRSPAAESDMFGRATHKPR